MNYVERTETGDSIEDNDNHYNKIKAFLEYHGFEFEVGSDDGVTPYIHINFDDDGNVL